MNLITIASCLVMFLFAFFFHFFLETGNKNLFGMLFSFTKKQNSFQIFWKRKKGVFTCFQNKFSLSPPSLTTTGNHLLPPPAITSHHRPPDQSSASSNHLRLLCDWAVTSHEFRPPFDHLVTSNNSLVATSHHPHNRLSLLTIHQTCFFIFRFQKFFVLNFLNCFYIKK